MSTIIHIDGVNREATPNEVAALEETRRQLKADAEAQAAAADSKAAALASARTKLVALGLSDAEVAALLGA